MTRQDVITTIAHAVQSNAIASASAQSLNCATAESAPHVYSKAAGWWG